MSDVVKSPEQLKSLEKNKRFTLWFWPTLAVIVCFFYWPPKLATLLLSEVKPVQQIEMQEQIETFQAESLKQQKQIETQNKLIQQLKQKANAVTLKGNETQIVFPVVSTRFISWQAFQQQKPKAKFDEFRKHQVEFLQAELDKANGFIISLKNMH